jgi:hypothetical protein
MKRMERILVWIAIAAVILKLLHVVLSGVLLIVILTVLSMIYFSMSWFLFPKPGREDQIVLLSIAVGMALSCLLLGILFKLQVWPMAGFFLLCGLVLGGVIALVIYFLIQSRRDLQAYLLGLGQRLAITWVVAAVLFAVSGRTLLDLYYHDQPRRAELIDSLHQVQDLETLDRLERELEEMERRP